MNVYDYRPGDEKVAAMLLGAVVLMVVVFSAGYLLGIRNVSNNGGGVASVGEQIEQAGTDIQHAADGIKEAAGTVDQIGSTIKDAKDTAGYIHSTVADSATIISECQQILEAIRRRGKADKVTH